MRFWLLLALIAAAIYASLQWSIRLLFRLVLFATVVAPVAMAVIIAFNMNERHWHWTSLFVLPPLGALAIYTWQTQGDTIRRAGYFQRVRDQDLRTEVRYR